jgi:hypothetical protein
MTPVCVALAVDNVLFDLFGGFMLCFAFVLTFFHLRYPWYNYSFLSCYCTAVHGEGGIYVTK